MYKRETFIGPFGGIVDDVPRPYKQPGDFDDLLNFFVREGRLQSRPRLVTLGSPPDGAVVRNIITYTDVLNNTHTLVLTTQNAYALTVNTFFTFNLVGNVNPFNQATALPYGLQIVNGQVFFSNGTYDVVYANGAASLQTTNDVPGAARFMCILADHLLLANTTEPRPGIAGSTRFPQRVRWSASGDPTTWTGVNSAGFNDLLDVPDQITGLVTLGQNAYVFRTNGVTVISPTGPPNAPFGFYNQSVSPEGVGNAYPYSLASFGSFACFVSEDDIYIFDGVNYLPIGGGSRKKIFADISGNSVDVITGSIVPNLGESYPYLSYWLSIPGSTGNIVWVFSRITNKWQRFNSPMGSVSTVALAAIT